MFGEKEYSENTCPLMRGPCIESKCTFWVHLRGQNPQGGAEINKHDCSIAWLPILLVENSQMQRQTGAAVESLRNENVTTGQQITGALIQVAQSASNQLDVKGDDA